MIQLQELTKRYGQHVAVDQLNLDVQPGELFGFLGPNGAGKTTTIKMMAGLLRPTSGRIVLAGHDLDLEPEKAKAALGFIPDRPFLYEKLSATEFLQFVAGIYGINGYDVERRIRPASGAGRANRISWKPDRELLPWNETATGHGRVLYSRPEGSGR